MSAVEGDKILVTRRPGDVMVLRELHPPILPEPGEDRRAVLVRFGFPEGEVSSTIVTYQPEDDKPSATLPPGARRMLITSVGFVLPKNATTGPLITNGNPGEILSRVVDQGLLVQPGETVGPTQLSKKTATAPVIRRTLVSQ